MLLYTILALGLTSSYKYFGIQNIHIFLGSLLKEVDRVNKTYTGYTTLDGPDLQFMPSNCIGFCK